VGRIGVGVVARRFDIYLVSLDPTIGSEIRKTRPCLVVSPDEMNRHIQTVIVAPLTAKARLYPTRVPCRFQGKHGQIVLDQIRTVVRTRLTKRLGRLAGPRAKSALGVLAAMFAE
jgi:mRNA interferase MazF